MYSAGSFYLHWKHEKGRCVICGIAGYIGQSKKPKLSYELLTQLFDFLEIRGTDAAGVWGTESGKNGRVVYHKEPIRSSEFIKKDFWKRMKKLKLNMVLIHARWKSKGNGQAATNSNNHPFVSADKRIGMVHNGTLDEFEFLKQRYQVLSKTDSEVLLRMYEDGIDRDPPELGIDSEISRRINGIQDIWSVIQEGGMAVAVGERIDYDERNLFLFRNEKRPLWIADLREVLGQVFFFSSPDVWYRAVASSDNLEELCSGSEKLIEIPTEEIWVLKIDKKHPMMFSSDQITRLKVNVKETGKKWEAGNLRTVKKPQCSLSVISELDDEEEIGKPPVKPSKWIPRPRDLVSQQGWQETDLDYEALCFSKKEIDEDTEDSHLEEITDESSDCELPSGLSPYEPVTGIKHDELCDQIDDLVSSIKVNLTNACMETSVSPTDYQNILESLEQTRVDLEGTLRLSSGG